MKTSTTTNRLRDINESEIAAQKRSPITDDPVTKGGAGIAEIRNIRVGCWRAPIDLWTEPTAA